MIDPEHTMKTEPESLERELASLPQRDAPHDVAQRVRRQAHALLAAQRAHSARPWMGTAIFVWSRFGMPVALASVVGVYLTWAFRIAGALYR